MHPLRHPRNAALVGVIFVVIGFLYWGLAEVGHYHVDYAGVTMLGILGISGALMAYVLVAGSRSD
jgi:lipopolysaccharide export LptBFGC system permease protein LptF